MATPPMHTETKHDLGRLTVTEVREPQKPIRPSTTYTVKRETEDDDQYLEYIFDIEYSAEHYAVSGGGSEVAIHDMRGTLSESSAWCGDWGTEIPLRKEYRENVERWFAGQIAADGPLFESVKRACLKDWEECH